MQLINAPGKLVLPFANSGGKNVIPVASQIGITNGAASFTDGFPPLTRTPIAAGGTPPFGLDMNGVLFDLSAITQWANAGAGYIWDSAFASNVNVGGYPQGARVLRSDGLGYWLNTVDNNTANPETSGAAAAGWVPDLTNGVSAVTMTNANVTLTQLQYGKPIIEITGTLTANVQLIFPAIAQQWIVINNTTGAYTITCKTAGGTGVTVSGTQQIACDATNMYTVGGGTSVTVSSITGYRTLTGAWVSNTTATWTAEALIATNSSNVPVVLQTFSQTLNTATSGGGGLDTGALAASTWYYVFAIYGASGVNILFSLSSTAPTMPSGYTFFALIGAIYSDASSHLIGFTQVGNLWQYVLGSNLATLRVMASGSTSGAYVATAWSGFFPGLAATLRMIVAGSGMTGGASVAPNGNYSLVENTGNISPPGSFWGNSISGGPAGGSTVVEFAPQSANVYFDCVTTTSAAGYLLAEGFRLNI